MSADPQAIDLAAPRSRFERASVQHADGTVIDLPLFTSHLLCDENGAYPAELNSWEKAVVEKEMARPGFVAWYRNPAQASQDSLGISYAGGGACRIMRPDFLFFSRAATGEIVVDIVDPHGPQFSDALPKLRGFASYAETHGSQIGRAPDCNPLP